MGSTYSDDNYIPSESDDEPEELRQEVQDTAEFSMVQNTITPVEGGFPSQNICLDSATDAILVNSTEMQLTLTIYQVSSIEAQLDFYEKVSLIYLLCDNRQLALTKLVENKHEGVLENWARSQNLPWQEKLIEALCVIQNFHILKTLGFDIQDLKGRFLPNHAFTTVHLDKFRRILYSMCERFHQNVLERFLKKVELDFKQKKLLFKEFPNYLELYLLYWETINYVVPSNLSNLYAILKQLDQTDLCEALKDQLRLSNNDREVSRFVIDDVLNPSVSLQSFTSSLSSGSKAPQNQYEINSDNPGICLIINQETFYIENDPKLRNLLPTTNQKLEDRIGTNYDKEKLIETFKKFGYKIRIFDNLDHDEIIPKMQSVLRDIRNESSVFICIMSHGEKGLIYGVNSCKLNVEDIQNAICSTNKSNLLDKPKVLILQACQGDKCQQIFTDADDDYTTDSPSSAVSVKKIPTVSDLLTFWATVPGFGAIRSKNRGSWFIQSLCDKMLELFDSHHFEDICTEVIHDVSSKKWNKNKNSSAMVPLKETSFRKKFFLPSAKKCI